MQKHNKMLRQEEEKNSTKTTQTTN